MENETELFVTRHIIVPKLDRAKVCIELGLVEKSLNMETKHLNIAVILKGKPKGTKLWSDVFGKIEFGFVTSEDEFPINIIASNGCDLDLTKEGKYYEDVADCLPCIYPSREMRDWEKFAWKKGDVLKAGVDNLCIFESWHNDDYTEFDAKFLTDRYSSEVLKTKDWSKETNENTIKQYISKIEEIKGGKLNLGTLEIEKQPEFKAKDWCLMRQHQCFWHLCQYAFKKDSHSYPYFAVGGVCYNECIPYNEQTKHLLGTMDEWKGGEG